MRPSRPLRNCRLPPSDYRSDLYDFNDLLTGMVGALLVKDANWVIAGAQHHEQKIGNFPRSSFGRAERLGNVERRNGKCACGLLS